MLSGLQIQEYLEGPSGKTSMWNGPPPTVASILSSCFMEKTATVRSYVQAVSRLTSPVASQTATRFGHQTIAAWWPISSWHLSTDHG